MASMNIYEVLIQCQLWLWTENENYNGIELPQFLQTHSMFIMGFLLTFLLWVIKSPTLSLIGRNQAKSSKYWAQVITLLGVLLEVTPCMHAKSLQLCQTLVTVVNYGPPGSSVHGTLQVRKLEWVAISFSRGSSRPTPLMSPALAGGSLPLALPGKLPVTPYPIFKPQYLILFFNIYLFGCTRSSLQQVGVFSCSTWALFPWSVVLLGPLSWES